MNGTQLKQIIKQKGVSIADIAQRIGATPQSLNSSFNSPDVKSGIVEKIAEALGMTIGEMYGESAGVYIGDESVAAVGNSATATNGDAKTIALLLDELKAQREQNARLVELLTQK